MKELLFGLVFVVVFLVIALSIGGCEEVSDIINTINSVWDLLEGINAATS